MITVQWFVSSIQHVYSYCNTNRRINSWCVEKVLKMGKVNKERHVSLKRKRKKEREKRTTYCMVRIRTTSSVFISWAHQNNDHYMWDTDLTTMIILRHKHFPYILFVWRQLKKYNFLLLTVQIKGSYKLIKSGSRFQNLSTRIL